MLPILIHGDAAFAGQGVVAETLNLSLIKGYRVGGTVHLIINNQLGFTTPPDSARSSEYPTDVAKMVQAPIFHVNGDDPEACVRVARLAFAYRQAFNKDVVIDMVCYRRHGHNEGDDPSYTQPLMYKRIDARRSVRKLYTEALVKRGDISLEEAEAALDDFQQPPAERARGDPPARAARGHPGQAGAAGRSACCPTSTPASAGPRSTRSSPRSRRCPRASRSIPSWPSSSRPAHKMFEAGEVDWALGEAMAYGSLLYEGTSVRLAGQDTRRGTFSHRHGVLVDYETGAEYTPLAPLATDGAQFWLYDSLLSEYAALGFEYGYSVVNKDALVIWEAQFGDFFNGAQIIVDQYLVAAEDKWGQTSGLVLLLPHGYEGQGPEHSSARIERFLTLGRRGQHPGLQRHHRRPVLPPAATPDAPHRAQAADRVHARSRCCGPRRRARPSRRWSTARSRRCSTIPRVTDPDRGEAGRAVLGQGRLRRARRPRRARRAGGRRPGRAALPVALRGRGPGASTRYPNAEQIFWLQEEPENMGPWNAVKGRLFEAHSDHWIHRESRSESGSPATGSHAIHLQEQEDVVSRSSPTSTDLRFPGRSGRIRRGGSPTTCSSSARATAGSSTLMVIMPMARAGLRLTPRSSRKTASDGSISSMAQAIS